MRKIRVFILTQNEPFYIPKVIRYILENSGDEYEVVGATVLSPHRKNKTILDWFRERARIYKIGELFLAGGAVFYCAFQSKILKGKRGNHFSVRRWLHEHNVPLIETADVNSAAYVSELSKCDIDIILSISPPQIFKEGILSVPNRYALNAHGTLLPRHRGVFGSWWTLFDEDEVAGATIHTMELRLDAGEIVWQKAFPVAPDDTQYSIAYKTKKSLAQGLVELLKKSKHGPLDYLPVSYPESYHRAPTKEEGKAFHQKGGRVITVRDLKYMLASKFDEEDIG